LVMSSPSTISATIVSGTFIRSSYVAVRFGFTAMIVAYRCDVR